MRTKLYGFYEAHCLLLLHFSGKLSIKRMQVHLIEICLKKEYFIHVRCITVELFLGEFLPFLYQPKKKLQEKAYSARKLCAYVSSFHVAHIIVENVA